MQEGDRVAQTAAASFDISVWQLWAGLLVGAQVQILPDEVSHDPVRLLHEVERRGITILETVPSLLRALLSEVEERGRGNELQEQVRWLLVTGEAFGSQLCRRWQERYGQMKLLNAYGPTECSDDVTHYVVQQGQQWSGSGVPIGRAIANTQLYVLDEWLEPVARGIAGQVYVGGKGVGRGYLYNSLRTAQVFVPDPFGEQAGGRLYATGDRGRLLASGDLEFSGRIDYQVKIRGYRIELGEIEAVLLQHPEVEDCVVVAREELAQTRLVAYVVGLQQLKEMETTTSNTSKLRSYLREKLPDYMLPSELVWLNELPLLPSGKVDRQALPTPMGESEHASKMISAPRTAIEEALVEDMGPDIRTRIHRYSRKLF